MKTKINSLHLTGSIAVLLVASALTSFGITNDLDVTPAGFSWDFEGLVNGENIADVTGSNGWYGAVDIFVATNTGGYTSPAGFPMTNSDHFICADMKGPVTNMVTGGAGETVWIDHMVKPERWKDDTNPTDLPTDTQMAYYVNTNNHVVIYHAWAETPATNMIWSEITTTEIGSSEWARVSIGMTYDLFRGYYWYKVKINGTEVSHTNGTSDPDTWIYNDGGSYFAMATQTVTQLNSIVMKGNGYFDDFVVSTNAPSFTYPDVTYIITAQVMDGASGGTLVAVDNTITSNKVVVADGSNQMFVVTAVEYWRIDKVVLVNDGVTTTNTLPTSPNTNEFLTVTNNGNEINVYFAANETNGVPRWWMNSSGADLADPNPTNDPDGDGFTTKQEWLSSTDPDNSNSFLRISRTWQDSGTNYVEWESVYVDPSLPPFGMLSSTDLVNDVFSPAGTTVTRGATNVWSEQIPTVGTFYQVSATNAP